MLCFFVVTKLLMLKLLLASISGLHAYDFGYHPSAEEFDTFVRETKRTWTRDLLANEHRRAWNVKPPFHDVTGNFVPKYNYDTTRLQSATKQTTSWPGYVQRVGRPQQHRYESPSVAAAAHALNGNAVSSSLNFNMFSAEQQNVGVGEVNAAELPEVFNQLRPIATQHNFNRSSFARPQQAIKQTLSSIIEIASSAESQKQPSKFNQGLDGNYTNHTDTQFPIYFSNPATGIIYAITEVGQVPDIANKSPSTNDSITMYITKQQYDRDLYLQRKYYENNCDAFPGVTMANGDTKISGTSMNAATPSNTTTRPQIIRLRRPSISTTKSPNAKLTTHLHKPPPVMVQTELTISDQIQLPTRKHKTKVKHKNKKKPNRPGRKPNTRKTNATEAGLPQIIRGVRVSTAKPPTSTEKQQVATQLEKPNYIGTVFIKSSVKSMASASSLLANGGVSVEHRIRKRSVTNIRAYMDQAQNTTMIDRFLASQAALNPTHKRRKAETNNGLTRRAAKRLRVKKRRPKLGNLTEIHTLRNSASNRNNWRVLKQSKRKTNSTGIKNMEANKVLTTNQTLNYNTTTELPQVVLSSSRKLSKKRKTKNKKEKEEKRSEFDFFGFGVDEDDDDEDERHEDGDDDDDDNEDEDEDSYEDEEEAYYEYEPTSAKTAKRKRHKQHKQQKNSESFEETEDYTEETAEQTTDNHSTNSIVIDDGSSAESGADFGAMELEENVLISPPTTTTTTTTSTTTTTKRPNIKASSKKRIRRRPSSKDSSASYEDYEYDDDGGGGIGNFFRMIFYPVQVLMNGMAENIGSKESEEEQFSYPTYTTYNNGIKPIESYEDDEEEQSSSLASWFSSWFGFNRRTKNIGSTTPLPPPPPPPPATEAPSWFESWFNFGNKPAGVTEEASDNDKWFFGWFDSKPKRRRKATTTTTTVRTPAAQVPILTIVDPLKNPQNWIGILAHHIINSTSAAVTHNPIINAMAQATPNPDVPRKVTYDRYQIWRLKPLDDTQVHALEEYKRSEDGIKLQWLKGPTLRGLTDILVPPKQLLDFEASLSFESIAHEVLIYDVGKAIAYEQAQEQFHFNAAMRPHKNNRHPQKQQAINMSWHKYYEYDDIITHLEMLRMRHPQLIELIHIGRSYEGRPLVVVKIESKEHAASVATQTQVAQKKLKSKKQPKEANSVFIESGTHGLEWIGPATSLWMITELLRMIKSNKTTTDNEYIKNTTWYFMPILNPDGYVYSHKYDRFWRKTRSRHIARRNGIIDSAMTWLQQKKAATRVCHGVDLDRNWHYQWGKRGSSKSPCNEFYAGPGPFSEPESKALSEFLIDYRKQIKMYISLQSYGQIISYPMKANTSFNAERIDDFLDVAMVGTDGLRKQGSKSRYKIDSTSDLVENRSGCSDAFAAYEVGIPFSFTIQLADNGVHGYLLPSASIEPTARDAFEIITAMVDYI